MELYKKVGKRYVKHDDYRDEKGLPCGLYLFYKPNHKGEHTAMMNMVHYAKVHEIQNVAKFCDLYVAHADKIADALSEALKEPLSIEDLVKTILAKLSEV